MAKAGDSQQFLQPPVLNQIRNEDNAARVRMERTFSQEIRDERADLKEAAEHSFNVVIDTSLDGIVRWVSPSWKVVIGTPLETVQGKPISEVILDKSDPFSDVMASVREDDSRSQTVRFRVALGSESLLHQNEALLTAQRDYDGFKQDDIENVEASVVLEGQGMMVFERQAENAGYSSDKVEQIESHMMWMLRPAVPPREITIDLPDQVVDALGFGAEVLAKHLTTLAEAEATDPSEVPEPAPILCRICERQISPWWFEKHTELCMQEHEAESRLQLAHEALTDHRNAIVSVLDALEARRARPLSGNFDNNPLPPAEYKGLPIGPANSSSSSTSASGRITPGGGTPPSSREVSMARPGHSRQRSFTVRRPLARIVELILDLCDTAIEIKTPILSDNRQNTDGEFRTQSPGSEAHISQVLQWQTPGSVDSEEGLTALNRDTERIAKAKVNATIQYRNIIEYSERIRIEFHQLIQDCIEAAMEKARQIREGRASDSSDTEEEEAATPAAADLDDEPTPQAAPTQPIQIPMEPPPQNFIDTSIADRLARRQSVAISTGSNSPIECPTPRSHSVNPGPLSRAQSTNKRASLYGGSDAGHESDTSSVFSGAGRRTESPHQDSIPSRTQSSRDRNKRRSLKLPAAGGVPSPRRAQSPGRPMAPPSPLRLTKARMPSGQESQYSPITSPVLSGGPQGNHSPTDHRRHSSIASSMDMGPRAPRSPRLSAIGQPQPKPAAPSIKDFEIIKPISKGAFGSVYLSKKKSTGDYYAIKVLKKSDMVAKNQVTNVKAERAIMMFQGESDFVAKLYWTFSSKDYLYLVMEYLNGGDCASLIKVLGGLPEDWAKKYLAEVILGVEHLHSRGIVHRDLKPDNLLIDQKGHLKLTDFGLSRMGLIGRQKRLQKSPDNAVPDLLKQGPFARPQSMTSSRSASFDLQGSHSPAMTPLMTPEVGSLPQPSYFSLGRESILGRDYSRRASGYRSDSGSSETFGSMFKFLSLEEPTPRGDPIQEENVHHGGGGDSPDPYMLSQTVSHSSHPHGTPPHSTPPLASGMPPPALALFDPEDQNRRFVGTPDYLAPETIRGVGQDEMSDWWSIGCILFEFLYGYPPFHADTPEQVFENILNRRIDWPSEEEYLVSDEARKLMSKLMTIDPKERLGSNHDEKHSSGGEEIRKHPWFEGVAWDSLLQDEAQFVPAPENPEDTEYFDSRGATLSAFAEEMEDTSSSNPTPGADYPDRPHDALSRIRQQVNSVKRNLLPLHIPAHVRDNRSRRLSEPMSGDDFGAFSFKNLPVLNAANKDIITKLRAEGQSTSKAPTSPNQTAMQSPGPSDSPLMPSPLKRTMSTHAKQTRSASPSNLGHLSASPNKISQPTSPLLVQFTVGSHHERRKTSGSSNGSLQPPGLLPDVPRMPISQSYSGTTASSPLKSRPSSMQITSPERNLLNQRIMNAQSRIRSQTLGSQESDGVPAPPKPVDPHSKRRSQVLDVSPSSSDSEDPRAKALLRVQRRRQSSRRLSQFSLGDGPCFRPLDVLICEDHPVSRLVMERLMEKLRCRTIVVTTGPDAVRYATSDVQFDIIMMEVKLPQLNGPEVAKMIRTMRNANQQTPIVAVTGYLKELPQSHHFDSLIQKPPTSEKLTDVISRLCHWKPPPADWQPEPYQRHHTPSGLRQEANAADSPSSLSSEPFPHLAGASWKTTSREDSIASSNFFGELDPADNTRVIIQNNGEDWPGHGLGITDDDATSKDFTHPGLPHLLHFNSAPPVLGLTMPSPRKSRSSEAIKAKRANQEKNRHECAESGDDEDEEIHQERSVSPKSPTGRDRMSKLGTQMMRTGSQSSVVDNTAKSPGLSQSTICPLPASVLEDQSPTTPNPPPFPEHQVHGPLSPPEVFPKAAGERTKTVVDTEATPKPSMDRIPSTVMEESEFSIAQGLDKLKLGHSDAETK